MRCLKAGQPVRAWCGGRFSYDLRRAGGPADSGSWADGADAKRLLKVYQRRRDPPLAGLRPGGDRAEPIPMAWARDDGDYLAKC